MSVSSAPEPPNVYLARGAISGNTFVSDAAASTVGPDPFALDVALADAELVDGADAADGCDAVEPEALLLPQPAERADTPITMTAGKTRRAEVALKRTVSLSERQNPGILHKSWH
jgi:hypothetical protein